MPLNPSGLDIKGELERLATVGKDQGRHRIEAVCLLAIAKLDELATALVTAQARRQWGGVVRAERLSPERRHEIAVAAAACRWLRRPAS